MLAGLIFATEDAADRPDALAATLPFGGTTLIEFQARQLIAAGAAQILIAVARVTPELLGAANRIGKRGVAVDVVRSAAEAAARVHPLARVVVLADGLVTTDAVLAPLTGEGDELLLVTAGDGLERIDATHSWAGVARVGAERLNDTAALPRDYDFLSTLLRVTAQHGATKLLLPPGAARDGHGIEHDSRGLAKRGRAAFAALAGNRTAWIDRWLFAPLARFALPALVGRGVSPTALLAGGGVVAAGGLWAVRQGWSASGLAGVTAAAFALALAGMLAGLRGDDGDAALAERGTWVVAGGALVLAGFGEDAMRGTATGSALAVAAVVAALLVERLRAAVTPQRWWASPAAYPLLLIPFAAIGQTLTGLAALALYGAATSLGGIEQIRRKA
ncbi:MAG: hypothetical protein V4659_04445 [Pseudomonadota bacterium]